MCLTFERNCGRWKMLVGQNAQTENGKKPNSEDLRSMLHLSIFSSVETTQKQIQSSWLCSPNYVSSLRPRSESAGSSIRQPSLSFFWSIGVGGRRHQSVARCDFSAKVGSGPGGDFSAMMWTRWCVACGGGTKLPKQFAVANGSCLII